MRMISLISWTDQGIKNVTDTVHRADEASVLAEKMGGKLDEIYWTVGEHDIVAVADFPDEETGTAFLLQLGRAGNVRTKTMRAYTRGEMEGILAKI